MKVIPSGTAIVLAFVCVACVQREPEKVVLKPQQAGQPINQAKTLEHIAAINAAGMTGDQEAIKKNMDAMNEDFRKAIKLSDPTHTVDRESARQAAKKEKMGSGSFNPLTSKKWGQVHLIS